MLERTNAAIVAFDEALDDDLNAAEALAAVFEYIRDTNTAMDAGEFEPGMRLARWSSWRGSTPCSTCCARPPIPVGCRMPRSMR